MQDGNKSTSHKKSYGVSVFSMIFGIVGIHHFYVGIGCTACDFSFRHDVLLSIY